MLVLMFHLFLLVAVVVVVGLGMAGHLVNVSMALLDVSFQVVVTP